jgi:hypothetical protein
MNLFERWHKKHQPVQPATAETSRDHFFGPHVLFQELAKRVPQYIEDADQGKLIYPACKRILSDVDGDVRSVWDHIRLEAVRYVMMVPGRDFELLIEPSRQLEMLDAYLVQRPHGETVVDFTGTPPVDFAIAVLAGLNWLSHCSAVARVHPSKLSGTLHNFRKVVTVARQWWLTQGASERCTQLLAEGNKPPLMFYLIWTEYTRLSKVIAGAAIFGSSIDRSTQLIALPPDLIPRFEAASDPSELLGI